jgi:DnaJ-class molecular chaperone
MPKDYYDILGIRKNADQKKIKKAYRAAVKKHHPDAHPGDGSREKFLEAKDAYDTLSNEESRREHDRELEGRHSRGDISRAPDLISAQNRAYTIRDSFISPINELFCGFLPDSYPNMPGTGRQNGKELFLEVILTVREATHGGVFTINVPMPAACPRCSRKGIREYFPCPLCRGSGSATIERSFSLSIPPHVHNGTQFLIRLDDRGLEAVFLHLTVVIDRLREGPL